MHLSLSLCRIKNLTSIIIPDSVTSIGRLAFYNCSNLTSVSIPDSVTSIGLGAFYYCSSLASINIGSNNQYYSSDDGVLFNKDKTTLIAYPAGRKSGHYSVPETVTSISSNAFSGCPLTYVFIPKTVILIEANAFFTNNGFYIYCEAESQPAGWNSRWNPNSLLVTWGYVPS